MHDPDRTPLMPMQPVPEHPERRSRIGRTGLSYWPTVGISCGAAYFIDLALARPAYGHAPAMFIAMAAGSIIALAIYDENQKSDMVERVMFGLLMWPIMGMWPYWFAGGVLTAMLDWPFY